MTARTTVQLRAEPLRLALVAIAALTALSGAAQLVAPGILLDLLGAESSATTRHAFAIVGMFMVVVGGITLQALLAASTPDYVLVWAGLQKAGAAVAVAWGVLADVFGSVALLVAGFDALTAVLIGAFWARLRAAPGR